MAPAVLLVEDDEPLRSTIARYLRARGYEVVAVPSSEAAREKLDAGGRPDLVILDINLPGDTGWELLRSGALRAAGDPPIIVATVTPIRARMLREFGIEGYLPKPFPLETLAASVERLLAASEAGPA